MELEKRPVTIGGVEISCGIEIPPACGMWVALEGDDVVAYDRDERFTGNTAGYLVWSPEFRRPRR
jgi:hypothetical protein